MKKHYTLSIALLACGLSAQAQITINQSSFASWAPGIDSFRDGVAPLPAVGNNFTLDLSNSNFPDPFQSATYSGTLAAFPNASFYMMGNYQLGGGAIIYQNRQYGGITAQGLRWMGETYARQAFGLGAVTMNNNDSVVINAQTVTYSTPRTEIAFPLTTGTTWTNNYNYSIAMTVTAGILSLNQTPAARKIYVTERDSVKGYGKVKLRATNGQISPWIDVLVVNRTIKAIDSFFINGAPASPTIMNAFGISQGDSTLEYTRNYYRAGEISPLVQADYDDAAQTILNYSSIHRNRVPSAVGVDQVAAQSISFMLYPNPARQEVFVALGRQQGPLPYQITNTIGQAVQSGNLSFEGGKGRLDLAGLAPGHYQLSIATAEAGTVSLPLVVQ